MYYTQEEIDALQAEQEKTQLALYLDEKTIFKQIRVEGDFKLTSGKTSNYFYDFELLTPNYMTFICGLLHEKLKKLEFEFVVGPAYGGIIPGYCVADFAGRKFVAFNPKTKAFRGNIKEIYGKYIIVDDVISTYNAIDETIKAMQDKYPKTRHAGSGCFVFRGDQVRKDPPTVWLHKGEIEI